MAKEKYEARVRIGDLHKRRYLIIDIKDVLDGQYGMSTAYPIERLNNEELVRGFVSELKQMKHLGYIIHYEIKEED